jgi:hypothetical protein
MFEYSYSRSTNAILDGTLINRQGSLSGVTDVAQFWDYVNNTLLTSIFSPQLNGGPDSSTPYPPADAVLSNYIIGDLLIYTWRISQDESCSIKEPFSEYLSKCYPWSAPVSTSNYGNPNSQQFHFTSNSDVPLSFPPSPIANMNSGGFFIPISPNATQAFQTINTLISNEYIDSTSSRVVGILFTLFNPNFQLFQSVRLFFEITETQFWKPPTVLLGSFPYWLTPSMFTSDSLNGSVIALFSITSFFILSLIIFLFIFRKRYFSIPRFLLLLLAATSVILLPSLLSSFSFGRSADAFSASPADRDSSPFIFFVNSFFFAHNLSVVRTIFGITLIFLYIQLVCDLGNILFLPSLRVLLITGSLIVSFGFSFHIQTANNFSISQSLVQTSFLWLGNWSLFISSHIGRLLVLSFYTFVVFGCFTYLWAGLAHKILNYRESVDDSVDKQVEKFLASFRASCKEYYEYLVFERFNLDDFFKRYFPGFYYRVIVEERRFKQRVDDAITKKSLNRNRRAGFIAGPKAGIAQGGVDLDKAAQQLQSQDEFRENLAYLDDAASLARGRLLEVDEELDKQLSDLSMQLSDIEKYISLLNRKSIL